MSTKKSLIKEISKLALESGYRVFIAEKGTYGFYTNTEGTRIISFQVDLGVSLSGNYTSSAPKQCGTGWRIGEPMFISQECLNTAFGSYPPRWAIGKHSFKFTTLEQHLKQYQASSNYTEVQS